MCPAQKYCKYLQWCTAAHVFRYAVVLFTAAHVFRNAVVYSGTLIQQCSSIQRHTYSAMQWYCIQRHTYSAMQWYTVAHLFSNAVVYSGTLIPQCTVYQSCWTFTLYLLSVSDTKMGSKHLWTDPQLLYSSMGNETVSQQATCTKFTQ